MRIVMTSLAVLALVACIKPAQTTNDMNAADINSAADMIATGLAMPVCPVRLGDRVAYSRCLITGQTAQEFEPHGKAAREIEQLHRWACEQVGMLPGEPVRLSA